MIYYEYYGDVPEGAIDSLLAGARLCRLITSGEELPHIGLYPFVHEPGSFALHLHRADEQIADLRERPRCVVEVDEVLSTIPSHWIDPENAMFATAFHRTAVFECRAELVDDAPGVAQVQREFMQRYQPEGDYHPVAWDDAMYSKVIKILVGVRLSVERVRVKFKLGQNRDFDTRALVARRLRERALGVDVQTAAAIEETIALRWTTTGLPKPPTP